MNVGTFDKDTLPGGRITACEAVTANATASRDAVSRTGREILNIDASQMVVDPVSRSISSWIGFASGRYADQVGVALDYARIHIGGKAEVVCYADH